MLNWDQGGRANRPELLGPLLVLTGLLAIPGEEEEGEELGGLRWCLRVSEVPVSEVPAD